MYSILVHGLDSKDVPRSTLQRRSDQADEPNVLRDPSVLDISAYLGYTLTYFSSS